MASEEKIGFRMLRVSEKVWEKLMRMKLDTKKSSIDELLSDILKIESNQATKETKVKKSESESKFKGSLTAS